MNKISVVLATFNEEKNIGRCLDSVKNLADEIIIVDGGSNDNTVKKVEGYGAKVKITDNPQIFHINKQKGIDMAIKDWILQLDADEVVPSDLRDEIRQVINIPDSNINGYWIPRKNFFLGRFLMKGGQYPDYTLRLYRRGKGRLPARDVHEQAEVEGEVGYLKHSLVHYPYKNFSEYLIKWDRYSDLLSTQIKKEMAKKGFFTRLFYLLIYFIIKPVYWFLLTYVRHKGFMDGWQGFLFSFFSALRFPLSYLKYLSGK